VSVSQILAILLRRVWIVGLTLLSTIITVGILLQFAPARYEAHATASIDPGNQSDPISAPAKTDVGLMQGNILSLVVSQRVAMGVLERLNVNNPQIQQVDGLLRNVAPKFDSGTNVLDITYGSPDPNQAALVANAFLAATIDAWVAMKAANADQTARWFAPQLDELRKELDDARTALQTFQTKANMVAPTQGGGDRETAQYMSISDQLSNARAGLTALRSRLIGGSTDLSNDPTDPDLQILSGLKERLTTAEADIAASKGVLGANNPKMLAQQANLASLHKQVGEATEKMRQHLKERIDLAQTLIASLEAEQEEAQKSLIGVQAQRDQLSQLQGDADFRARQLDVRERAAEEAELKSKLTFSAVTVLDKAVPPVTPAFPKPVVALPVGIAAGLALGLILALLAEAADRSVRFPVDLEYSASAPFLGALDRARPSRSQISASRRSRGSA
jgi:succinoglycan biosynthesis transport protein ExoP